MSSGKTAICNLALNHLGMEPVSDLDDLLNPSALACNTFFNPCRDDVFSEHRWPFATVISLLAELPSGSVLDSSGGWFSGGWFTTPWFGVGNTEGEIEANIIGGYLHAYQYPSKAATVWNVFNLSTSLKKEEQEFEVVYLPGLNKKAIASDLEEAYCEYTHILEDTTLWNSKFVMCLSYRLAAEMAPQLVGDAKISLSMKDIYNATLQEAKRISWSEKRKKPNRTSSYQSSRG